jgi:hypothetical protein
MGDPVKDKTYYSNLETEAKQFGAITEMINKLPMGKNGYTFSPEMEQDIVR